MNDSLAYIPFLGQKIWLLARPGPEEGAKGERRVAKVERGGF